MSYGLLRIKLSEKQAAWVNKAACFAPGNNGLKLKI